MRENRTSGSEGGGTTSELPTPIDVEIRLRALRARRFEGSKAQRLDWWDSPIKPSNPQTFQPSSLPAFPAFPQFFLCICEPIRSMVLS